MIKRILCLALVCLIGAHQAACRRGDNDAAKNDQVLSDQQSAAALVKQADQLYAQRDDLVRVKQGIILLRQALTADYKNYEAAWRLAMFNYYLGAHTAQAEERERAYHDGIEAGKTAVKIQTEKPEGHFWLGANYGGSARTGVLAGLAAIEDIRREMDEVIRLDPNYQGGSAYMVLGQVYLEAPKMFGGDTQKSIETLEEGLRHDGEGNSFLRLTLAKAYLADKRDDEARKQLDAIAQMKPDPEYLPEYRESSDAARELINQLKK